jgi:hypothetical protein
MGNIVQQFWDWDVVIGVVVDAIGILVGGLESLLLQSFLLELWIKCLLVLGDGIIFPSEVERDISIEEAIIFISAIDNRNYIKLYIIHK